MSFETVYRLNVLHHEFKGVNNKKLIDSCLSWRDRKIDENPNATGFEDSKIPDDIEVVKLKQEVIQFVHAMIDDRYINGEIWAHILQPMQSTMIHSHRQNKDYHQLFLSWVYYPQQQPQDMGGRLRFQYIGHHTMATHEIIPKESHIYFFPSWLNHYTTPNISNDDRISISGNLKLKDEDYEKVYRDRSSGIHDFYR